MTGPTKLKMAVAFALGAALLAGCKRHEEPVEQQQVNEAPAPAPAPPPEVAPEPAPEPKPVVEKPKPLPPTTAEQQVIDDAEATGMTARVDRSAGDGNGSAAESNSPQ